MGAEVKAMEVKKPQESTASERAVTTTRKAREFIADIKSEIQKITWTNRDELLAYTKIVVGATFIFGMAIYTLDLVIQGTLSGLNLLLNVIAG